MVGRACGPKNIMWTEEDDNRKRLRLGGWNTFTAKDTLREEYKIRPPIKEIWPDWTNGVPTRLRRLCWIDGLFIEKVRRYPIHYYESIKFKWIGQHTLPVLRDFLPGDYTDQWSGVYRIFVPSANIARCCGSDPTGTIYIGRAGNGEKNWSTLRTRIKSIITREHHAIKGRGRAQQDKYPCDSLAVEWAFTNDNKVNRVGKPWIESVIGERWLLNCYKDSFGELPPLNERA
jgi:hypothetical protein